jgi:hypothetical protein
MTMMSVATRAIGGLAAVLLLLAAPPVAAQEGAGNVVYVPTPQQVVDTMLEMAGVGPADTVIDLGSGDGRMIITAAKKFGARGLGVDLDRYLLKLASGLAEKEGVADRARFIEQNLFETDLAPATVITSYLLPEMNLELRPKILALKPGTRVVAHDYDMGNWPTDQEKVIDVPGKTVGTPGKSYVFLYIVPAKVAGTWRSVISQGRESVPYEFAFDQEFQFVQGTARAGKREGKVPEFRLAGDRIEFTTRIGAQEHRFAGTVKGDRIEGTVAIGRDAARPWTAELSKAWPVSEGGGLAPRKYRHLKQ